MPSLPAALLRRVTLVLSSMSTTGRRVCIATDNRGNMKRQFTILAILLVLGGCAGIQRSCTSWWAESFASDWIVVQNDYNMIPKRC
jgi:hypothetical protein